MPYNGVAEKDNHKFISNLDFKKKKKVFLTLTFIDKRVLSGAFLFGPASNYSLLSEYFHLHSHCAS
jgi:hypothetical protein